MSVMEFSVRNGMVLGIVIALISTICLLCKLHNKRKIVKEFVFVITGVLFMIPYILCYVHGEEYVEVTSINIYSEGDKYLYPLGEGLYEVFVKYGDDYYTNEFVTPASINKINDDSEPRLEKVTTYLRFKPFEISNSVYNAFVPKIE